MKNLLLLCVVSSFVSCSQNPDPAVSYLIDQGSSYQEGDNSPIEDELNSYSLSYKGGDFFGADCSFDLTAYSSGEEKWRVELGYILHGNGLPALDVTYHAEKNALVGVLLTNGEYGEAELVDDYVSAGELQFYLEIQPKSDFDYASYTRALDLTFENTDDFSLYKEDLNKIKRLVFKALHVGHYDAGGCFNYSPSGVNL